MEHQVFDQLARESVGAPTRRTLARGLAAVLGASGLGLKLALDADAGKSKQKKRRQRQKRKEKQKEKKHECDAKNKVCTAPTNPCQTVACEDHKCVTSNVANGTVCGDGLECNAGQCVCPNGLCTVRVTASNLSNWVGYNDDPNVEEVDNTLLHFRSGPGSPPYGSGSVELDSPAGERYNLATYQFAATKLSDITSLKFTTYSPTSGNTGSPNSSGYLHFNVDFFGSDAWQKRLVYVPSNNGTVTRDTWQEWDAIDGGDAEWLWSDFNNPWPGGGSQPDGSEAKTWSQLLTEYPDIQIRETDAFFGIRDGSSHTEHNTEEVDSVTFGTASGTTRFVFGTSS